MEKLIANLSSKVQKKVLQGRSYLVAPVAMLLPGVFAGSEGPIYYDETELVKSVAAWNHKPITMGHPELPNGVKVSGCTPETLESYQCGMVLNARFNKKTKKLVAEAWFEESRLAALEQGHIIANALANEIKMEVSTGLFVDKLFSEGEHNGTKFTRRAVNFQPDHLAIILNGVGACSLADGAGLLVNKAHKDKADCRPALLVGNEEYEAEEGEEEGEEDETSLMTTVDAVRMAVYAKYEKMGTEGSPGIYPYIEDIYEESVVFCLGDKVYRQNYAEKDGSVTLLGELIPVTRKVTYEPLVANEKATMDRTTLATALGDSHKEFVTNLSDEQVAALLKLQAPAPVAPEAPAPAPVANTLTEVVDAAPEHLQSQLKDALIANQRLRDSYVAVIVANKANAFSAAELGEMSTGSLEKLASLATVAPAPASPAPVVNKKDPLFAGSPVTNSAPVEETAFSAPSTL
jgi:hypothetical protein